MSRPCCDPCCHGPDTVYARIVGGCACVDGLCIPLVKVNVPPCDEWQGSAPSFCGVIPVLGDLSCCPSGCMGSDWGWASPSRTYIYGGTLLDDWTCVPFFQHWTGMHWDGDPTCVGVTFDVIISETPC